MRDSSPPITQPPTQQLMSTLQSSAFPHTSTGKRPIGSQLAPPSSDSHASFERGDSASARVPAAASMRELSGACAIETARPSSSVTTRIVLE